MRVVLYSILIVLAGCSSPTQRPTAILAASEAPAWENRAIYADTDFSFVARYSGGKVGQEAGFLVYSKKAGKWMEITQLSTENAKLGRSPKFGEGFTSISWDYRPLRNKPYAPMPLKTSASPEKIVWQPETATYLIIFDSGFRAEAVMTQFIVRKADLEKAFEGEGAAK